MSNAGEAHGLEYPQPNEAHSFLRPVSPNPTASTLCTDLASSNSGDSKGKANAREGLRPHHRTPSDSFLLEEPSWLHDLLNEPETRVRRATHRRSSSDSIAHSDALRISWNVDNFTQEAYKHQPPTVMPPWGSQELDFLNDLQLASHSIDANLFGGTQDRSKVNHSNSRLPSTKHKLVSAGTSSAANKLDASPSTVSEGSQASQSEMERKRAKQSRTRCTYEMGRQFAQRSRVRKLQYIAELESSVQALQAEGLEFSAQLQFLDQQNILLCLENKALKQRLDCLVNDHLLKCFQHEMLGQEVSRLRTLYKQQQQQQWPRPNHRRSRSSDIDSKFAFLSIEGNEFKPGPGPLNN